MPEMMVAVSVMVVVTAVVAGLFVQVRKMIGITQWGVETRAQLRAAVDALSQDLQNLDDDGYLLMLNRDYGPGAAILYPGETAANKTFWADRIAFVADGPFNNLNYNPATGIAPPISASARVYYGHSLWTHELADAVWARSVPGLLSAGALAPPSPQQYTQWTGGFDRRPAVNWVMVRQAVLKLEQPAGADPNRDMEFLILANNLGLYTWADAARWIDAQVAPLPPYDWVSLLWAPRVFKVQEDGPPVQNYDPTLHQNVSPEFARNFDNTAVGSHVAAARVLVPHTARIRFQVRLSDGTIVPQTDEANENPWLRGRLVGEYPSGTGTAIQRLNPGGAPPLRYPAGTSFDPTVLSPARSGPAIPVQQTAFVWTADKTNIRWYRPGDVLPSPPPLTTQHLYPVGVRIRAEVYDLDRRTPDPIVVDEWLPVRWGARPERAP